MQRAMNEAQEIYMALYNNFFDQSEEFLEEMQAILNALEKALDFSEKWKASKINRIIKVVEGLPKLLRVFREGLA